MRSQLIILLILTLSAHALADEFYGQNFSAVSGGSTSLSSYGWNGYFGNLNTAATTAVAGGGGTTPNAQVSGGGSAPAITQTANAPEPVTTPTYGIAFFATPDNSNQYLLETNVAVNNPTQFSWYQAGATSDSQRLAIEIGTQWYLSNTIFTVASANTTSTASNASTKSVQRIVAFTTDSASWSAFDFPNSFTVGGNMALTSSSVAAFGVYETQASAGTDKNFVDSFEVDVAPEPTIAVPAVLLLGMLRKRRR